MKNRIYQLVGALFIISTFTLTQTGCGTVNQSMVSGNKRVYSMTWAQEVELGKQSHPEILAEYGEYKNTKLATYVNQIGQQVLLNSEARDASVATPEILQTPFTFTVLDSPVVNAFALPGGYIYVTRGLLAHLDNEAQLAVVLGHEIAHVIARHTSIQMGRQQRSQIYTILGVIAGSAAGVSPDLLQTGLQAASTVVNLKLLSYGRDAEREADDLGVKYAAKSGYVVGEASRFFGSLKRIQEAAGAKIPAYMSTHPDPGEREQTIQQKAQTLAATLQMAKVNQQQLFAQIDGIKIGEDPRQGFDENNIFYHPDMKFQFPIPQGWVIQNGTTEVQMGAVVNGAAQAVLKFTVAAEKTAQEAAAKFSAQRGLKILGSNPITVNGMKAYVVEGNSVNQQGQAEYGLRAYFIEYGTNVYYFLGLTAAANLATWKPSFDSVVSGFKQLTDVDKLNRQPSYLTLQKASRIGVFQTFVPQRLSNKLTAEGLAIMNQVQLGQSITQGATLKLVR